MTKLYDIFHDFYKNRDLIIQFTKREIEPRHKSSKLGHLWALITPSMMLSLYFFVFGLLFGGRFGVLADENFYDFALALFVGISLFQVIADAITSAPNLIASQPNFVKKVVFPLQIMSLCKILASLYFCSLSLLICILLTPLGHGHLSLNLLLLPIVILPLGMLALGLSWGLCSVGVFVRDIEHTTAFASTAIMYGSAIVYSINRIPAHFSRILKYNPLVSIVDQSRGIILWSRPLDFKVISYDYLISIGVLVVGYALFQRLRPYFAEVI
jgi:lipopolysaccharide transport system permease protein